MTHKFCFQADVCSESNHLYVCSPLFTWLAFQKAEVLADKIFVLSKRFPAEERFSLTDQIRRFVRTRRSLTLKDAIPNTSFLN